MKHLHKIGSRWIEIWRDDPPKIDPCAESLMLWIGIMLTVLNILAAILVFG